LQAIRDGQSTSYLDLVINNKFLDMERLPQLGLHIILGHAIELQVDFSEGLNIENVWEHRVNSFALSPALLLCCPRKMSGNEEIQNSKISILHIIG
jgi:hypothetical protein